MSNQPPQNPTTVDGICPTCSNPLTIPFPPIILLHDVTTSVISIPHTRGVVCKCGAYYNIIIMGAKIELGLAQQQPPLLNDEPLIKQAFSIHLTGKGN